jgi:uncharacterized membrane protein YeaQ/YmgE (transglycosylase-associated protein family)
MAVMTALSLIIAVTVGVVAGAAGRALVRRRSVPLWLLVAAGVAAAVLATVVARMAGVERPGPTVTEVVLQILLAAAGVALVAATADRERANGRIR